MESGLKASCKRAYATPLLPWVFDELLRKENSSIVLCVSPLTSLMIDQREKFTANGLTAEFVGGVQDDPGVLGEDQEGVLQLVYISPESLLGDNCWREMLRNDVYQTRMVAFCVDEAHCVKNGKLPKYFHCLQHRQYSMYDAIVHAVISLLFTGVINSSGVLSTWGSAKSYPLQCQSDGTHCNCDKSNTKRDHEET